MIVVDDRDEFALRVWRYVSRTIGIDLEYSKVPAAAADVPSSSETAQLKSEAVELSPDGEVSFSWFEATSGCRERIAKRIDSLGAGINLLLLIDVKGKEGSLYDPRAICRDLGLRKRSGLECVLDWMVVSSYPSIERIENQLVERKSLDTLKALRKKLYSEPGGEENPRSASYHVLITGAGFEVADAKGGFGMPHTREVLKGMGPPFRMGGTGGGTKGFVISMEKHFYVKEDGKEEEAFPVPVNLSGVVGEALKKRAERGELDLYWDVLLDECLWGWVGRLGADPQSGTRGGNKTIALQRERQMREAFRRSLLVHDWGYMNQSLVAATLEWNAWMTTNYTKFADRAIELTRFDWRIISTAAEANISIREDLGGEAAKSSGGEEQWRRFLFKLHGDIAHLHTMAIAGHDKDLVSLLCLPVDSLYQIYNAAERFLRNSLWTLDATHVIWHVVGHGMQDTRLAELMRLVCLRSDPKVRHTIVVVNPRPDGPVGVLRGMVGSSQYQAPAERVRILSLRHDAADYMARIERPGLVWFDRILPWSSEEEGQKVLDREFPSVAESLSFLSRSEDDASGAG